MSIRRRVILFTTTLVILMTLTVGMFMYIDQGTHAAAGADSDSPYGFTTTVATFNTQGAAYMQDLHLGWVRTQMDWKTIETKPGVYNWSLLDRAVNLAASAHGKLVFPIRMAPSWHLTQKCVTTDKLFSTKFPGPDDMQFFATQVALRYNGQNGHGRIDAIQIGNEEWDNTQFGKLSESVQCRQPKYYAPVLDAAYQAIKAIVPSILVVGAGLFWKDPVHQYQWYSYLYANGYANSFDVGAFHFYMCTYDPIIGHSPSFPSFGEVLGGIQKANTEFGIKKPIWVTETGWNIHAVGQPANCIVSQAKVAQYLTEELNAARTSGLVTKVFIFTVGWPSNGMSLTQGTTKTLAYTMMRNYVASFTPDTWVKGPAPKPSPT